MTAPVDRQRYRDVIGHFATGVAVITAHGPGGPAGMTANALCSLSLDPLLLLVCFDRTSRTLPLVRDTGRFAVNVLRHEQHALSGTFASKLPEREKFNAVAWRLRREVPVFEEALAWLTCEVQETHPGGDHVICVGTVTDVYHAQGHPLVWFRGGYATLGHASPAEARLPN
jgi:3-hydroxy-9,10-secoandrosta-1,3,5(10)-triene-9,17-dione monooxygenase reductase component